jgi:hypothetical protein
VVGGSTDYPVRAEITTVRKSMNCQPTGQMRLSMGDGTMPYTGTVSGPGGLTIPINITNSGQLPLILDDIPAGNYSIELFDGGCSCVRHYNHTLLAMDEDVFSSNALMTIVTVMMRSASDNDCKTIIPQRPGNASGLGGSEAYYFNNRSIYYEYCYSLDPPGSINYAAQTWTPLTTLTPTYSFPTGSYASHAQTNDKLWLFIRPQVVIPGYEVACANAVKYQGQNLTNYVYAPPASRNGGLTAHDNEYGLTVLTTSNCDDFKFSLDIHPGIGLCYPVVYKFEDPSHTFIQGTATAPGLWIGEAGASPLTVCPTGYLAGQLYTVTITDNNGSGRTFTTQWKGEGQKFTSHPVNSCEKAYRVIRTLPNTEVILPGTQFKYIEGPIPSLPCGISKGGAPFVVPAGNNSVSFYPQNATPMVFGGYDIPAGVYKFEITNSCGIVQNIDVPISSFGYYEKPVQYVLEKADCEGSAVRMYPKTRLYQDFCYTASSGVYYNIPYNFQSHYQIKSCSASGIPFDGSVVTWNNTSPNPPYLELPDPTLHGVALPVTYTIAFRSLPVGCEIETFDIVYDGDYQKPFLKSSEISAYICQDDVTGYIKVSAVKGKSQYTYTIKDPFTEMPLVAPDEISENPIIVDFYTPANFVIPNAKSSYKIEVEDDCGESVTIEQDMIKLTTPKLIYITPPSTAPYTYCPGENIELNVVSLGGVDYSWTGPNGFSAKGQYPRFMAHPNGTGWYVVSVTPEFCPNLVKDSIYIEVLPAPPPPAVTHTQIYACFMNGDVNLNSKTGATATELNTLLWYNAGGTPIGVAPWVQPPANGVSVIYYVEQGDYSGTDCKSERVMVTLKGDCSICTDEPLFDPSWIPPTTACVGTEVITVPVINNAIEFIVSSPNASGALSPTLFPLPANVGAQITYVPNEDDAGKTITIIITAYGETSCPTTTYTWEIFVNSCNTSLNLTLFLEGVTTVEKGVASMSNYLQEPDDTYENSVFTEPRLPNTDSYNLATCIDINNPAVIGKVVDWIKVEIWGNLNTTGARVKYKLLEEQALLLRPDGSVVNTEGELPTFTSQYAPVWIVVKHRNHLAVMSNMIPKLTGAVEYNFSLAATQAICLKPLDPVQMKEVNGVYCLWAGDTNDDGFINNADTENGMASFANSFNMKGTYCTSDFNMNGIVNYYDISILMRNFRLTLFSTIVNCDKE